MSALNDITRPMLERGRAEASDFPRHFASRCIRLPELLESINGALFALREREHIRKKNEENRTLLARQYAGITDVLRQLGAEVSQDLSAQPLLEQQVRRYTAAFGWIERVSVFRDGGGRLVVELFGEGVDDVLSQGAGFSSGLSALIGVGLGTPYKAEDELGARIVLRERAPFRAIVGVGRKQKEGSSVSGDSAGYFLTDAGTACLLLADGMGTGATAERDSRTMTTTVERFLRAGIGAAEALRTVAPAYRLRTGGARFVTLDVLTVDLFTGRGETMKCGAAPSYVRMGGRWSRLDCKTLPVGLDEEEPQEDGVPLRFAHGDLYIMLSDGVSDGVDDRAVRALLAAHADDSPKELAARLTALQGEGQADDDRTAIVLRIERVRE